MNFKMNIVDEFSKNYLPFKLYRDIVQNMIIEYNDCSQDHCDIYDLKTEINKITNKEQNRTIIFLNMYDLTLSEKKNQMREVISNNRAISFTIINTEHWETRGAKEILTMLQNENRKNISIIEYNIINFRNIVSSYPDVRVVFLPLIYDKLMEKVLKDNIESLFNTEQKDIDVLFYGGINDRRKQVLDALKGENWNVYIVDSHHGVTNKELCNLINRSKIVINILYYDFNVIFDYYRNSFVLSNNTMLISEIPLEMDTKIEPWLHQIEELGTFCSYDKLVETTNEWLKKDNIVFNEMIEKQSKWFKGFKMQNKLWDYVFYHYTHGEFPIVKQDNKF